VTAGTRALTCEEESPTLERALLALDMSPKLVAPVSDFAVETRESVPGTAAETFCQSAGASFDCAVPSSAPAPATACAALRPEPLVRLVTSGLPASEVTADAASVSVDEVEVVDAAVEVVDVVVTGPDVVDVVVPAAGAVDDVVVAVIPDMSVPVDSVDPVDTVDTVDPLDVQP